MTGQLDAELMQDRIRTATSIDDGTSEAADNKHRKQLVCQQDGVLLTLYFGLHCCCASMQTSLL